MVIIVIVAVVACLIVAICAAGMALERRMARKIASSLLSQACPFCGNLFRRDTIRSARLEHGFEDQDVSVICSSCSKTVYLFEKDRYSIQDRKK
jgi:hypothetical protein